MSKNCPDKNSALHRLLASLLSLDARLFAGGGLLVRREDTSQVWTATQTLEGLGKSCGGKGGGDKDGELHRVCLPGLDEEVQEEEEEKVNGAR